MKNILLENMLRFGTKNLSNEAQQTLSKLAEQTVTAATNVFNPAYKPLPTPTVAKMAEQDGQSIVITDGAVYVGNITNIPAEKRNGYGITVYKFTQYTIGSVILPIIEIVGILSYNDANVLTRNEPQPAEGIGKLDAGVVENNYVRAATAYSNTIANILKPILKQDSFIQFVNTANFSAYQNINIANNKKNPVVQQQYTATMTELLKVKNLIANAIVKKINAA